MTSLTLFNLVNVRRFIAAMTSVLVLVSLAGCESSQNSVRRSDIDSDFAYTPSEKEKKQLRSPSYEPPSQSASEGMASAPSSVRNGPPKDPHLIKPTPLPGSPPPLPASQQARAEEKLKALNAAAKSPTPSSQTAAAKTEKTMATAGLKPSDKDKDKEKLKEKEKEKAKKSENPLPPLPGTVKKKESDPTLGTSVAIEPDQPRPKQPKVTANSEVERREEPPRPASSGSSSSTDERLPTARPVPGKRGFVFSPYVSGVGPVDIRGFASGTKVQCPYTRKVFLVP